MTTHGDIRLVQPDWIEDGEAAQVWLHAYSDGHTFDAIKMLNAIPEWLAFRSGLRAKMEACVFADAGTPGPLRDRLIQEVHYAGPWWIGNIMRLNEARPDADALGDHHLGNTLVNASPDPFTLSGHAVRYDFGRWHPMPEAFAPWHTPGQPPSLTVICGKSDYHIVCHDDADDMLAEWFGEEGEPVPESGCVMRVNHTERLWAAVRQEARNIEAIRNNLGDATVKTPLSIIVCGDEAERIKSLAERS